LPSLANGRELKKTTDPSPLICSSDIHRWVRNDGGEQGMGRRVAEAVRDRDGSGGVVAASVTWSPRGSTTPRRRAGGIRSLAVAGQSRRGPWAVKLGLLYCTIISYNRHVIRHCFSSIFQRTNNIFLL
jgi:hypothetical protein